MYPHLQIGSVTIGTYGICLLLALVVSWKVLEINLKRHGLPPTFADWIILLIPVTGLVGSKLYHLLQSPVELWNDPSRLFNFTGGFAWLGGLLAGLITLWLFARFYEIPALKLMDLASPVAALGYAIGRLGCFLAGDGDYGIPTSLPWGMSFPDGIIPTLQAVHPTPVYESIINVAIFYFLWRLGEKPSPPGSILALYLLQSGLARFLVEFIRVNPSFIFGLSNAQVVSLLSIAAGLTLRHINLRTPRRFA